MMKKFNRGSYDPIAVAKAELRREAIARRDALPAAERQLAAETIAAREFPVAVASGTVVSGFFPMKSEISPLPLLRKLAALGAQLALPVVAGKGQAADHAGMEPRRAAGRRRVGHPRARPRGTGGRARHPDRAAARVRSPRPPYRLWRRLLRLDDREAAGEEAGGRGRHRPCGPGNRRRAYHPQRCPPRSRANRE